MPALLALPYDSWTGWTEGSLLNILVENPYLEHVLAARVPDAGPLLRDGGVGEGEWAGVAQLEVGPGPGGREETLAGA